MRQTRQQKKMQRRWALLPGCIFILGVLFWVFMPKVPKAAQPSFPPSSGPTVDMRVSLPGSSGPDSKNDSYHFAVRGKKFRPSNGERLQVDMLESQTGALQAAIFTSQGHLVRTLADLIDPKGTIHLEWDGRDPNGKDLAPGPYVLKVKSSGKAEKVSIEILSAETQKPSK